MSDAVCPVNRLHHDWQNGLTCRWCSATRTPAEAIVSGLASRRGGDEDSARALLDAHRAAVLAADGQAYDGELAMLRGLARTLRVVVRPDDTSVDVAEVRRLLHEHAADEAEAREKSSPAGADATPEFFQPGHTYTRNLPYRAPELRPDFQCTGVGHHPTKSEPRAFGFYRSGSMSPWGSVALNSEAWADGWVDVTEGGAADA